jgi:hypothetical protein
MMDDGGHGQNYPFHHPEYFAIEALIIFSAMVAGSGALSQMHTDF